ncbi:MAG: lamin tail domain-containing protein [Longimicrobiaceae bacterium]
MLRPAFAGVRFGGTPLVALLAAAVLAACSDQQPVATRGPLLTPLHRDAQAAFECTGSTSGSLSCTPARTGTGDARGVVTGGQNTNVKLTSSNVGYNSQTGIFQFDVTVQNLMNEAMGTPDGTVADPDGIQVFFGSGPNVTSGTGSMSVANADGTGTFTATNQPYFAYHEILAQNAVSAARTWQLQVTGDVGTFNFTVYIETDLQYLLVINEVLANAAGTSLDTNGIGDWFELYNAGSRPVKLDSLVIADSAASGRRPYHVISTSIVMQPGAYVVLGNTTNTTSNGGVTVDYAYGNALALANSLDAVKIARVYGTDTLTIDRTQYAQASVSAKDGISRELKNPALDNSNMDSSNWGDASVTSVYGTGGRGTPKAQNSTYTP